MLLAAALIRRGDELDTVSVTTRVPTALLELIRAEIDSHPTTHQTAIRKGDPDERHRQAVALGYTPSRRQTNSSATSSSSSDRY